MAKLMNEQNRFVSVNRTGYVFAYTAISVRDEYHVEASGLENTSHISIHKASMEDLWKTLRSEE